MKINKVLMIQNTKSIISLLALALQTVLKRYTHCKHYKLSLMPESPYTLAY